MSLEKNLTEPVYQDVQEMVEKHHEIMKNLNLSFNGEALDIQDMVDKHHAIKKSLSMINMNMNEEVLPFNNTKDNKRKSVSESAEQKNKVPCKESEIQTPESVQKKLDQLKQSVILSQASTSQGFSGWVNEDQFVEKLEELKHSLAQAVEVKKAATQRLEVAENKISEIIKKLDQKCDTVDYTYLQPPDCFNNEFLELDQDLNKSYKLKEAAVKELESIGKRIARLNKEIATYDWCFPKKTDPKEIEEIIKKLPTRTCFIPINQEISLNKDCYICHGEFLNDELLRTLPCSHEYHASCLDPWLKKELTCPVCRVNVY